MPTGKSGSHRLLRCGIQRWKPNKSGRVLIWPEQGLGDLIMFSSVIPEIYKQVKKLIVQIDDRLIPLFKRSFPSDIIYFGLTERITEEQYDKYYKEQPKVFSFCCKNWHEIDIRS